ncbi:MAG: 2-isopropylmalate synthase [Gammaproteobacteria bacterium]
MNRFDHRKYRPAGGVTLDTRRWPDRAITKAPRWCSVDLRDGNQALVKPMSGAQKGALFDLLVQLGFKEIEVGFPAASKPDFEFVRSLIERGRIPLDVTIQVLTQARDGLIERTFEALQGVRRAIVHVYNSTNPAQREQVFGLDRDGVKAIAVAGARAVQAAAARHPDTEWVFQYSPESFSQTEPEFALEVVDAVNAVWRPQHGQGVIVNLPATVESTTPNRFADLVEWFCDRVAWREHLLVSVHTHNDRGCAVAAAELAVMAGADRVEGTLFGNGERTGNMDIVTMAMNLYSQGVAPRLEFADMSAVVAGYTTATGMAVPPRHPWAGELVYTAFSGSHQDAIRKGMAHHRERGGHWEVPYLPIDPRDLGRRYEEVVRINSQSGKGGVAHVLERDHGISLPRWLAVEFSHVVQADAERTGSEVNSPRVRALFEQSYVDVPAAWVVQRYQLRRDGAAVSADVQLGPRGHATVLRGRGKGVLEAVVDALERQFGLAVEVEHFDESAVRAGTDADAMACVSVRVGNARGVAVAFGEDSAGAALQAVLAAVGGVIARAGYEEVSVSNG